MPSEIILFATSGCFTARATSAAILFTMSRDTVAGAMSPIGGAKSYPGMPAASATVGTSGANTERFDELLASSFTAPLFACGASDG